MPNINKILLTVTIVLVLFVGGLLYWQTAPRDDNYYAVLTLSGDLFFGQLHTFGGEYLTDVYTLQKNPNDTQNPISLVKFSKSFFGPEDRLDLSQKNIVWRTKLSANSQVLAQIKNPTAQQQQQVTQAPPVTPVQQVNPSKR